MMRTSQDFHLPAFVSNSCDGLVTHVTESVKTQAQNNHYKQWTTTAPTSPLPLSISLQPRSSAMCNYYAICRYESVQKQISKWKAGNMQFLLGLQLQTDRIGSNLTLDNMQGSLIVYQCTTALNAAKYQADRISQ